ncbi:hypothetical protein [Alteromonas sp. CYL-A6]|uniref:hypothetical protein n=1 Tax=Alteromonas nitratireducens TaxID=3390813 RepID=UPI0034BB91C5
MLLLLCVFCLGAGAQQLDFRYRKLDTGYQFDYRWRDDAGNIQTISFTLPAEGFASLPQTQPEYKQDIARRYVVVEMLKAARRVSPRDARIDIHERGDNIQIAIKSPSDRLEKSVRDQLVRAQKDAFDTYLTEHYYTAFTTPLRENAVKPDHLRYIRESVMALIPLSQAFYEKIDQRSDARAYFNVLLNWAQSIPYDPLEDRSDSNGAGFAPPLTLLMYNKGDCDSKAVLTAAAARAFLPNVGMILVLLREHALLGIALSPRSHESTLNVKGTEYVLFDPTGPALMPFGQVSEDTRRELATGLYTTEVIQ